MVISQDLTASVKQRKHGFLKLIKVPSISFYYKHHQANRINLCYYGMSLSTWFLAQNKVSVQQVLTGWITEPVLPKEQEADEPSVKVSHTNWND